ncbi:MAG: TIGR03905 family TSCPD domain-containing protein [Ruminococcaceae bacterium]|nr:TIGR03905 family TSCPD domain-containing protein [Oscillospiraceae bacterium]
MTYQYTPKGVCSRYMEFSVENGKITDVVIKGGCNGNLKGICALVKGMDVDDVINKLKDIKCGFKDTSCPAQLAIALTQYKNEKEE